MTLWRRFHCGSRLRGRLSQITKPLLERQRRARINRCLDELKDLMSAALAAEGENLTKLEKADVLELTVRHLHQLHREGELTLAAAASGLFGHPLHSNGLSAAENGGVAVNAVGGNAALSSAMDRRRYQGGFLACAQQVASYVMKTPGLEPGLGQRLLAHLARCAQQMSDPAQHPAAALMASVAAAAAAVNVLPPMPPPPPVAAEPPAAFGASFPPLPLAPPPPPPPLAINDPLHREYSITAQFQVYRNTSDESAPLLGRSATPDVLLPAAHDAESATTSSASGVKQRPSSALEQAAFPQIPKKRYAHVKYEETPTSTSAASTPAAEPTSGVANAPFYVVESRILQLSPAGLSPAEAAAAAAAHPDDCKDPDSMWRPW